MYSLQKPFVLNFDPNCGVFFDFRGFQQDLVSVLGHTFNGDILKMELERQWKEFVERRRPEVWYQKPGIDDWVRQEVKEPSLSWLLRNNVSASCGLLFSTPIERLSEPVFVFLELRRNPKQEWRLTYPYYGTFSIRDKNAKLLEPIETIAAESDQMTRSERFRILVHKLRYYDNSPVIEDPVTLLSTLGRLSDDFDEADFAKQLKSCYEEDFERDGSVGDAPLLCNTELKTKKDITLEYGSSFHVKKNSRISLLFQKESKVHVLFGDDVSHPVPLSEFYPSIDRFLNRNSDGFDLRTLAEITKRQNWDFTNDKGKVVQFGSLNYYLELTFGRIDEDIKVAETARMDCQELVSTPDGKGMLFCTGLTHREFGSFIYACCSDPDDNGVYQTVKWVFGIGPEGDRNYPQELCFPKCNGQRNHGLPYPANWTREPEKLVFQYQRGAKSNIHFRFDHMFGDHLDRIKSEGTDATGIGDKLDFDEFVKRIESAWPTTRKLLEANYKNAIPTYYEGDIQLLVPLFLDKRKPSTPSAALVLARDRNREDGYYAPTFLTLEMARNNALVITRVDDSWLTPDPLPGTISWLQGQLADEPDEEKKEKIRDAIERLLALTTT